MGKKGFYIFFFIFFLLNLFISNKIYASLILDNILLADSLYSNKSKDEFAHGEDIYVHYSISGLKENFYGSIWIEIEANILDEKGNVIHKNIVKENVRNKMIFNGQFKNHLVFKIPSYLGETTVLLNIIFKDQNAQTQLSKNLKLHIIPPQLCITNVRFLSEQNNFTNERPPIFLPKEKIILFFNILGLKKENNQIQIKYKTEIKNKSENYLINPLINMQKKLNEDEEAVITCKSKFTSELPGDYTIKMYVLDEFGNKDISSEVSYQVKNKESVPSISNLISPENLTNKTEPKKITTDLFDSSNKVISINKKENGKQKEKNKNELLPVNKSSKATDIKKNIFNDVELPPDDRMKLYNEDKGLYLFKYPREWIIQKDDESKKIIFLNEPGGEAKIMIYVCLVYLDSIDPLISNGKLLLKDFFPGMLQISDNENIMIADKNAIKFSFKGYIPSYNKPSLGELIIMPNISDNFVFLIFTAGDMEKFEAYRKFAYSIIHSFKIPSIIEIDKIIMTNLIGTWQNINSDINSMENTISFYENGKFIENKNSVLYDVPKLGQDYKDEIFYSDKTDLNVSGKYKIIGDTLYLLYENGNYSEFTLYISEVAVIRLNQKIYKKK